MQHGKMRGTDFKKFLAAHLSSTICQAIFVEFLVPNLATFLLNAMHGTY